MFDTFILIFVFILGAFVGSFLNVCIYRIPKEESIIIPSSHCTSCNHPLSPIDLIPILSYFIQRGKCRYCGEPFSWRYPLVEFLTAVFFLLIVAIYKITFISFILIIFTSLLIVIFFIDLDHQIIPNSLTYPGIVFGLITSFKNPIAESFKFAFLGSLFGGVLFLSIAFLSSFLFSKEGMGGGDIKLACMMGAFLGFKNLIIAIFLSFTIGGIVGIFLMRLKVKGRKDYIPFGPALVSGTFLALFFGKQILSWYSSKTGFSF
jgi:leader peptidase (prepilin peptidase)/N-methyltransferase